MSNTKVNEALKAGGRLAQITLCGGNVAFASMLRHPRAAFQYAASSLFLHRLASRRGLAQKKPQEILRTGGDTQLAVSLCPQSWFHSWDPSFGMDLFWLCLITRLLRPTRIFEIGTSLGVSALHFALNSPEESRIYTLDLPKDGTVSPALTTTLMDREHITEWERSQPVFANREEKKKITELFCDSALFDFGDFHGNIDLFFIDGAHSYAYVKSDTERAFECCRVGGVVLWHDYGRYGVNGVTKYLHQLAKTRQIYRLPGSAVAMHLIQ